MWLQAIQHHPRSRFTRLQGQVRHRYVIIEICLAHLLIHEQLIGDVTTVKLVNNGRRICNK
jgi:anthranilate/para-aminobenzoate synthase component II